MINVPPKIARETFKTSVLDKLNNDKLRHNIKTLSDYYKCPKDAEEYSLQENLPQETLVKLDYVLKRAGFNQFDTLKDIAEYFRMLLDEKKYIVLFAYNGTGKTRLSAEFKSLGQHLVGDTGEKTADTLYYNAFTEDLFSWDNDLENDTERVLKFNNRSRFFSGLKDLEMENKIESFLHSYADFDFEINYEESKVTFSRSVLISGTTQRVDKIKISRGEENIFVWCFFLAVAQLVADKAESYDWVKYIYIDDPISSLDDNNVISVASHLAQLINRSEVKVVVSSHHTLFFNVLCNELSRAEQLFLHKNTANGSYILKDTTKTPFFHHVALLVELKKASDSGELYTYHFNILRNILEKTASFHGFKHFSSCVRKEPDDADGVIHKRMLDIMSHGGYSLFEPQPMVEDNKEHFKRILSNFITDYNFNRRLIEGDTAQTQEEQ